MGLEEEDEKGDDEAASGSMAVSLTGAGQFSMFPDVPLSTTGPRDSRKHLSRLPLKHLQHRYGMLTLTTNFHYPLNCTAGITPLTRRISLVWKTVKGTEILNFMKNAFNIQVLREVKRVSFVYEEGIIFCSFL